MCFAPQRRALFRHLNFQKWSGHGVFCTFSLRNVLRATTACTFSTSQLPKVVRTCCVLYILAWKCNLSLLSASSLLCFSSVHIVGSLTSKLPSVTAPFVPCHTVPLRYEAGLAIDCRSGRTASTRKTFGNSITICFQPLTVEVASDGRNKETVSSLFNSFIGSVILIHVMLDSLTILHLFVKECLQYAFIWCLNNTGQHLKNECFQILPTQLETEAPCLMFVLTWSWSMNNTCLPRTIRPGVASVSLKVSTVQAKPPVIMFVRAESSLASSVANGTTFRSASSVWSLFQDSLTHLKALSGSVDAATTASCVLILQLR